VRKYGFVLAVTALLVAVWGTSASAISSPQVLRLLAVDSQTSQPMNGFMFDRAPRAGDQVGITENLYKWARTKGGVRPRAGRDVGIITFLRVSNSGETSTALIEVQAYLSGGTVFVEGVAQFANGLTTFTLPVVGGTRKYDNVRGHLRVKQLPGSVDKEALEFHLLP
jgi:hypothetical protein